MKKYKQQNQNLKMKTKKEQSVNKNIDSITVVRGLKKITTEAVAKEQYGILAGKVDTLVALPLSFTVAFATALVPGLSSAKAKNDDAAIEKRVKLSLLITILIGLPCAFGLCVFAKEILQLVFPNAAAGANILQSISFLVVFATLAQTINGALQGLGDFKTPVIALILGVIVKTILNIVIIPIQGIGILGATVSSQICQFIAFFIGFIKLKKMTKIKFDFNKFDVSWLLNLYPHTLKEIAKNKRVKEKIRISIAQLLEKGNVLNMDKTKLQNILTKYFC